MKEVNQEHVINSLASQISGLSLTIAQNNAVIIEQQNKINELQQKLREKRVEEKANAKK